MCIRHLSTSGLDCTIVAFAMYNILNTIEEVRLDLE